MTTEKKNEMHELNQIGSLQFFFFVRSLFGDWAAFVTFPFCLMGFINMCIADILNFVFCLCYVMRIVIHIQTFHWIASVPSVYIICFCMLILFFFLILEDVASFVSLFNFCMHAEINCSQWPIILLYIIYIVRRSNIRKLN